MNYFIPNQIWLDNFPIESQRLLLINLERGMPMDLILTRIPVTPICIKSSVISELKAGTNEDYLIMKLLEIVLNNSTIFKNKSVVNIQMYTRTLRFLSALCSSAKYLSTMELLFVYNLKLGEDYFKD